MIMANNAPLCIYHAFCADGYTAAWTTRKFFGDGQVDFHPGVHGEPPPDVTGRHVIITDFSYKQPVILEMAAQCKSLAIIDHHETAQEDLAGLPALKMNWFEHTASAEAVEDGHPLNRVGAWFDMDSSGCALTWRYFFAGRRMPNFLQIVQDRDLWRFALPGTREITAVTFSHPYSFDIWDELVEACDNGLMKKRLVKEGQALLRKHDKDIAELLPQMARPMTIGGIRVPAANLPYVYASDGAGKLAEGQPFGATYWDGPEHRNFSLRSRGDGGYDVSAIARQYGGGGHKNAAGFRVPLSRLVEEGLL